MALLEGTPGITEFWTVVQAVTTVIALILSIITLLQGKSIKELTLMVDALNTQAKELANQTIELKSQSEAMQTQAKSMEGLYRLEFANRLESLTPKLKALPSTGKQQSSHEFVVENKTMRINSYTSVPPGAISLQIETIIGQKALGMVLHPGDHIQISIRLNNPHFLGQSMDIFFNFQNDDDMKFIQHAKVSVGTHGSSINLSSPRLLPDEGD
ncbi:hypothetical protein SAMN05444266_101635 [Chitinophaga jiangningensis]|uniref:Uncharacterized protein n=1 Tax=Chitinophaga jiangningensis TaxID=1419482 RepID=A0A1M6WHZ5_9BACT|nr:hypothetical protein [Chitinophaga jiangningensis]SHK93370.1 hypothetical protein SAMN05444266_101635 [Chitinophaga jiangningensis]